MENLLNETFKLTEKSVSELIKEFEGSNTRLSLRFKSMYKDNDRIIIQVIDDISKCPFELFLNEDTLKLEMI